MSPLTARQRAYTHHYGPWILGGGVVLIALVIESSRHHVVSEFSLIFFLVLIPTIIIHEISHGIIALWCGDPTAKEAHRLTLNPLRHIDLVGSIILPVLLILSGAPVFGWAKPVPVNVRRLRHPRNQSVLVSLAGPAINIVLAIVLGFGFVAVANESALMAIPLDNWPLLDQLLFVGGLVNVWVAAFNLIPIPPLDGSAVIERFLPASALPTYYRLRAASMVLVLVLVFFGQGLLDSLFNHSVTTWANLVGIT